jgi:hypothetical protein
LPAARLGTVASYRWVLCGLAKIVVGLVPKNENINLHLLGALNVPVGSVAILLVSLAIRRTRRRSAAVGVLLAVAGLVGTVLSTAGEYPGSALYLGLGVGGMERVASYPGSLWLLVAGPLVLVEAGPLVLVEADPWLPDGATR